MQKFLWSFSICALIFTVWYISAYASDDITSAWFLINLGNLDPVHALGTTVPTGMWAATWLLNKIAWLLLFVMPLIAWVSLIIAWYYYILSSWDSEKASKAKMIIKWNAIAILIALFSYAIIRSIAFLLDGSL